MSANKQNQKRLTEKRERRRLKRLHLSGSGSDTAPRPPPTAGESQLPTRFTVPLGDLLEGIGPIVRATWSAPQALIDQLRTEGKPIPNPVSGWVLVDTGARKTCIAQHTADQLGLTPQGTVASFGAHGAQNSTRYRASFALGIANNSHVLSLEFPNHEVMGIPKMKESFDQFGVRDADGNLINVIGVLGREFLRHTKLRYDGPAGLIELEIDVDYIERATLAGAPSIPIVKITEKLGAAATATPVVAHART